MRVPLIKPSVVAAVKPVEYLRQKTGLIRRWVRVNSGTTDYVQSLSTADLPGDVKVEIDLINSSSTNGDVLSLFTADPDEYFSFLITNSGSIKLYSSGQTAGISDNGVFPFDHVNRIEADFNRSTLDYQVRCNGAVTQQGALREIGNGYNVLFGARRKSVAGANEFYFNGMMLECKIWSDNVLVKRYKIDNPNSVFQTNLVTGQDDLEIINGQPGDWIQIEKMPEWNYWRRVDDNSITYEIAS